MGLDLKKVVPDWHAEGTEPPSTLKQTGFQAGYKPPANYFNWFWSGVSAALLEMQQALSTAVFGVPVVNCTSSDGVTYTATVDGITTLTAGLTIVIIPDTVSTSVSAKLNVNSLGAKYIRQSTTNNTTTGLTPKNANWMAANKPITIQYDGTQWKTVAARSNASDMNGVLPIANGGTGATTAEEARENLGITFEGLAGDNVAYIDSFVVQSWVSEDGLSWYRKYSDGYIEQAGDAQGAVKANQKVTVHLPTAFTTTNYCVVGTLHGSGWDNDNGSFQVSSKTTTTFLATSSDAGAYALGTWYACGY